MKICMFCGSSTKGAGYSCCQQAQDRFYSLCDELGRLVGEAVKKSREDKKNAR